MIDGMKSIVGGRGGSATREAHGKEFFRAIGAKGGRSRTTSAVASALVVKALVLALLATGETGEVP